MNIKQIVLNVFVFVVLSSFVSAAVPDITTGLTNYWNFDGVTLTDSVGGITLTAYYGANQTSAVFLNGTGSVNFTGNTLPAGRLQRSSLDTIGTNSGSANIWFKWEGTLPGTVQDYTIWGGGYTADTEPRFQVALNVRSTGMCFISHFANGGGSFYVTTDEFNCTNDEWFMLTWVDVSTTKNYYINGVLQNKTYTSGSDAFNSGFLKKDAFLNRNTIGSYVNTGAYYKSFSGYLDQAKIYNRVLTAEQIEYLYNYYSLWLGFQTITTPAVNETTNITYDMHTNVGLVNCSFYVNGVNKENANGLSSGEHNFNFTLEDSLANTDITLNITCMNENASYSQTAGVILLFTNCSSGSVAKKFSFKDELTDAPVSAVFSSVFNYFSGGVLSQLNYDFTDTNFSVCISPQTATTTGSYEIYYSATGYPTRIAANNMVSYDNSSEEITLYLLNNTAGAYITFSITDQFSSALEDVLVSGYKRVGSNLILVEQRLSDGTGVAQFYVELDKPYTITFIKEGYTTISKDITPTSAQTYNVQMALTSTSFNYSDDVGTTYSFIPRSTVTNNTAYDFQFNLTSSINVITACSIEIYNRSLLLDSAAGVYTGSSCTATLNYNTSNHDQLLVKGVYQLNNVVTVVKTKQYTVLKIYTGTSSLQNFIDSVDLFTASSFNNFSRGILMLIIIVVVLTTTIKKASFINEDGVIIVFLGLVWIFSLIGWLYLDYANLPTLYGFEIKKHIIASIITIMGFSFLVARKR